MANLKSIQMYCGALEGFTDSVRSDFELHFGVESRKAGEAVVRILVSGYLVG